MKALKFKQTALSAFVAVALAGCSLAPDYKRPDAPVAGAWPDQPKVQYGGYAKPTSLGTQPSTSVMPQEGTPAADLGWREFFRDPRLQSLIELA
ncbi:multidrug transporter, partial [Achromobacter insolitus]|nr:multidrug transporter [Achromobacter insolitus]